MPPTLALQRRLQRGFTLIELMIVVAVVAILAAIAIPAYTAYVTRSKLTEAFSTLSSMSVALQQYDQDNRTYVGAPICGAGLPTAADYAFACSNLSATTFTITAQPINGFSGPTYTIDQDGAKTTASVPPGWTMPNPNTCWVRDPSGDC